MPENPENAIRLNAFKWLKEQTNLYGDVLPREILTQGFYYNNQRVTLVGPQGIWKPKILELPISITTVTDSRYKDSLKDSGLLIYKYRGNDPNHHDNKGLRKLLENNIPLIYFFQLVTGKYLATWPVYIVNENRANLSFTVAVDDIMIANHSKPDTISEEEIQYRRSYFTANVKQRIHQRSFRERVLNAYNEQCTFCTLKHRELLDAAHIIPDNEKGGQPIVLNGLSLCKIHHAAFDTNILGVSPDYTINVRKDILDEVDGPMLKYGLQLLNNKRLILPHKKIDWPDKDRLSTRYNKFLNI